MLPVYSITSPSNNFGGKPIFLGDCKAPNNLRFKPIEAKTVGGSVGTIYRLSGCKWVGKIGNPTGYLRHMTNEASRFQADIDLDVVREYIVGCCFTASARNAYLTPDIALSRQSIHDEYTKNRPELEIHSELHLTHSLRIMSAWIDGYQNFASAQTVDENGDQCDYVTFLKKFHRPPECIFSLEGNLVPIYGDIELYANGRAFADVDVLGGDGKNAGFIWIKNENEKIVAARAVKIDPGLGFQFERQSNDETSQNPVIDTLEKIGIPKYWLQDVKDTRLALANEEVIIRWEALKPNQKERFLHTLMTTIEAFSNDNERMYFLYRNGEFNRKNKREYISKLLSVMISNQMQKWFDLQKKIYHAGIELRHNVYFDYPIPTQDFVGRELILSEIRRMITPPHEYQSNQATKILLLKGIIGLGKSELARQTAFHLHKHFSIIQWIEGETEEQQLISFLKFAQTLGLELAKEVTLNNIQGLVYSHLSNINKPWLLIIDNLDTLCTLPSKGGYVLLTSQKSLMPLANTLEIKPFSTEEGVKFFEQLLANENPVQNVFSNTISGLPGNNANNMTFVNFVDGNPLVLRRASTLLKVRKMSVILFLEELAELYGRLPQNIDSSNTPLIIVTLSSLKYIKERSIYNYRWLQISSFLDHAEIHESWIHSWLIEENCEETIIAKCTKSLLTCLHIYGFIRHHRKSQFYSMHPKLQQNLQILAGDQESFGKTVLLLLKLYNYKAEDPTTWESAKKWLIHATKVWQNPMITDIDSYSKAALTSGIAEIYSLINLPKPQHEFCKLTHQFCKQTFQTQSKLRPSASLDLAESMFKLGISLVACSQYNEALSICQEAFGLLRINFPNVDQPHVLIGDVLLQMSRIYICLWKYKEALDCGKQALTIFDYINNNNESLSHADAYLIIASCQSRFNNIIESTNNLDKASHIYKDLYKNKKHPRAAKAILLAGSLYLRRGLHRKALIKFDTCVKIYKEFKKSIELAQALAEGADCHLGLKNYDIALEQYNLAHDLLQSYYGVESNNPHILYCLDGLARVLYAKKEYPNALAICREVLRRNLVFWGDASNSPSIGSAYYLLSRILKKLPGNESESTACYNKAKNMSIS